MNIGVVIALIKQLAPKADPSVIAQAVDDYLDAHPEIEVADGSITEAKLAEEVANQLEEIPGIKNALQVLEPSASNSDIGKMLKVKTVSGGKVTEYEFGEGGGTVDPSAIAEAVDDWLDEHPEATTTVEDGSVTLPKLSNDMQTKFNAVVEEVHDPATNFINYDNVGEGYIKSDGTPKTSGNWHNTGYVELVAGESYFFSGLYSGSSGYYAWYADDKSFISFGSTELTNPFVVPSGAKYGRFSKNGNITTGVWIAKTNSEPSAYGTMLDSPMLLKKNQGSANAGKPMEVSNDGTVKPSETDYAKSKLWKKGNLYKASEMVQGKYIYKTGAESSNEGYSCTPFLPVSGTVYLQNSFSYTYYAFYNENKQLVASYETLGDLAQYTPGIKYVNVPSGAVYARFSYNGSPHDYLFISCDPELPYDFDMFSVDKVYPNTFNPDNPCDYSGKSVGIFHKCACVGDSLTYGTFDYDEGATINVPNMATLAEMYSYPTQLTKLTGIETVNLGDASETWKTWYEAHGSYDYTGCDMVIIHLGVNDAAKGKSDEETEEYMIELIDTIKASVMNIKIFVCTLTPQFSNDRFPAYPLKSQLIRDVYEANYGSDPDVFLLDMETYSHVRRYTSYVAGHMTALGYQRWAQDCANYISWIIDNNMRDFRFVQFIGSDRTYSGD